MGLNHFGRLFLMLYKLILFLAFWATLLCPVLKLSFRNAVKKIQRVLNEAEQVKASAEAKLNEYVKKIEELGKEIEAIRANRRKKKDR
jgi:F0F1-type ATP synthase membrane subunit b/b'